MVFLFIIFTSDEGNVRRMDTAVKINRLVQEKSSGSSLIMINLPKAPTSSDREFICIFSLNLLFPKIYAFFLSFPLSFPVQSLLFESLCNSNNIYFTVDKETLIVYSLLFKSLCNPSNIFYQLSPLKFELQRLYCICLCRTTRYGFSLNCSLYKVYFELLLS